ncbi:MAG TPA: Ig-like domain-containing protein, partial [Nitrospira sp.]|nr:Ig-like domain-containing protein [Nitrospira sp.]
MTSSNLPSGGGYGQTATTILRHQPPNGGYDCISWGAIVFSTAVEDIDGDGLPDGLEDATGGLLDPDGEELPNLNAMGGGSDQPDVFIEVNAMEAEPGTTWGSADAPYDSTVDTVTDNNGHHHMPTPENLEMIGDAFGAKGIRVHFDVGSLASYQAFGIVQHSDWVDDYTLPVGLNNKYLVGNGILNNVASLARGGEIIKETACTYDPVNNPFCHFPDYPGTVLWKLGLQAYRDAMVDDDGIELTVDLVNGEYKLKYHPEEPEDPPVYFNWNDPSHTQRRRFDPKRKGLFRYLLNAHARAMPRSLPCLEDGHPAPYDVVSELGVGSCLTDPTKPGFGPNPDFQPLDYHVPSSASGIADLPGGDALVTLGLWDEFVGRPFARAGTTFHELGHNLELWHGGLPAILGNKALNTATYIEPNCKPNYLSSMSYLFQVHALFDNDDQIHLDYSGNVHQANATSAIDETIVLLDNALSPLPTSYVPAWFAPANSPLAQDLGVLQAGRFCSGEKFDSSATPGSLKNPVAMARVHAASTSEAIDWDGDPDTPGVPSLAVLIPDVNFDGAQTGSVTDSKLLNGFNDWLNIRLNQIGAVPVGALPGSLEGLDDAALIFWDGGGLIGGRSGLIGGRSGLIGGRSGLIGGRSGVVGGDGWHEGGLIGGRSGLIGGRSGLIGGRSGLIGGRSGLIGGRSGQEGEVTYKLAKDLGKTRPHGLTLCNIGTSGCSNAAPSTPELSRVAGSFNAPPFGTFTDYEVQRKRTSESDDDFDPISVNVVLDPETNKLTFIDYTELADGVHCKSIRENDAECEYAYRVRGLSTDGNTGWSLSKVIAAVNNAPAVGHDGVYQVNNKSTLTVPSSGNPGLLVNDTDPDSPTGYIGRRAVLVSGPVDVNGMPTGTLTCGTSGPSPAICANGSFRYVPPKGASFVGLVTFTYKSDDGLSNDGHSPQVPLSSLSGTVTVSINVFKK